MVDGIIASCYPSYQSSGFIEVGGVKTPLTHHAVSHAFLAPLRMLCNLNFDWCKKETYTDGISDWVFTAFHVSNWVLEQHAIIQGLVLLVLVPYLMVVVLIEEVFLQNWLTWVVAGVSVFWFIVKRRTSTSSTIIW